MGTTSKSKPLSQDIFRQSLETLVSPTDSPRYVIAYSGGVDSHVLLHLCTRLGLDLRAVHVHHGLQGEADSWIEHCRQVCASLGVDLQVCHVDAGAARGESPEAAARNARYQALAEALNEGEVMMLGQHKNDQAETVLLQMLRGSGVAGLAAMPQQSRLASGQTLLRPLLNFSRQEILDYARQHSLQWVEDPSNQHTVYRRNALRHHVLPAIEQHWPQAIKSLHQIAGKQQDALHLFDELARIDLATCLGDDTTQLRLRPLTMLSARRRFNLLRYWLHLRNARPNRRCIEQILQTVVEAAEDTQPVVKWNDFEVRRFDQQLYLLKQEQTAGLHGAYQWQPKQSLQLPLLSAVLHIDGQVAGGLDPELLQQPLCVRFRRGGERILARGARHHQSLKKLFQQAKVAPWQRQRIPLLFRGEDLLAVCGHWLSAEHCVSSCDSGWAPRLVHKHAS